MGNTNRRSSNPKRNSHLRREKRQIEAQARQNVRKRMTDEEQLKYLDAKLGVNIGATKERKRLALKVNTKSVSNEKPMAPEGTPKRGNSKAGVRKNVHRIRPKKS